MGRPPNACTVDVTKGAWSTQINTQNKHNSAVIICNTIMVINCHIYIFYCCHPPFFFSAHLETGHNLEPIEIHNSITRMWRHFGAHWACCVVQKEWYQQRAAGDWEEYWRSVKTHRFTAVQIISVSPSTFHFQYSSVNTGCQHTMTRMDPEQRQWRFTLKIKCVTKNKTWAPRGNIGIDTSIFKKVLLALKQTSVFYYSMSFIFSVKLI